MIKVTESESFAGVLTQCPVLAHLDLSRKHIDAVMKGRLRDTWCGDPSDLVLENYEFDPSDEKEDEEGEDLDEKVEQQGVQDGVGGVSISMQLGGCVSDRRGCAGGPGWQVHTRRDQKIGVERFESVRDECPSVKQ